MIKNYQVFIVAFVIFLIDRLTKFLVMLFIAPVSKFVILQNILSFYYIENTGAAFSLLKNHIGFLIIFSFITVVAISLYFLLVNKSYSFYKKISWGLILGGSLGNFFDRVCLGYVVDFISLDFVNFAIFNIADIAINVGVIMLIVSLLGSEDRLCYRKK